MAYLPELMKDTISKNRIWVSIYAGTLLGVAIRGEEIHNNALRVVSAAVGVAALSSVVLINGNEQNIITKEETENGERI